MAPSPVPTDRAHFHSMKDSTREEWQLLSRHHEQWLASLPDRVLAHLSLLGGEYGGFAVDRLTHSLQTATRAQRDGRDDEYVVCALLHDIGDPLAPENHPDVAAAILRAYVSPENLFMVEKHDVFQGYYFWHHLDDDRNARERFRGHPFFEHTAEFCELYDQSSFDPDYESLPLAHFEPLVRALLAKPRFRFFQKTPDTPAEAGRD